METVNLLRLVKMPKQMANGQYTALTSKRVRHCRQYNKAENTLTIWVEMSDKRGVTHWSRDKVLSVEALNQSRHMETMLIAAYEPLIKEVTDLINTFEAMGV